MTLITKPDFTYVWASGGAVVAPNDSKKQLGWVAEAPPFQYDNWLQNRQDQMLAHINQRGIPAWDGLTNYEAGGLSYVQGSDGKVYKSVAASGPSSVVSNPTTDVTDTYWTVAFASTAQATETVQGVVELATGAEVLAGLDALRALTPANAVDGLLGASSLAASGYATLPIKVAGVRQNLIIQWGNATVPISAGSVTVTLPLTFPNASFGAVGTRANNVAAVASDVIAIDNTSLSQIVIRPAAVDNVNARSFRWQVIGY